MWAVNRVVSSGTFTMVLTKRHCHNGTLTTIPMAFPAALTFYRPICTHRCEKMASCIGSQVVLTTSFTSPCPCSHVRRTSWRCVMWAVHPGSTTTVLMSSSKMAGPGTRWPGRSKARRNAGVCWRPPRSKKVSAMHAGSGRGPVRWT